MCNQNAKLNKHFINPEHMGKVLIKALIAAIFVKALIAAIFVVVVVFIVYTQVQSPSYEVQSPSYVSPEKPRMVLGNVNAEVKVVEFGDLQCPACRAAHGTVKTITEEYGEQISYEFKHFPLESIHPFAFVAAQAAECAHDQDIYYEFIDAVFNNQNDLSRERFKATAASLGAEQESFTACLDSGAKRTIVREHQNEGRTLQVRSTPTFFVNGQPIASWQIDSFRAALDAELAQ